jgi:lipopolysaccharide transport system ATP-binding protein
VAAYIGGTLGEEPAAVNFQGNAPGDEDVRLLGARLLSDGLRGIELDIRRPLVVEIDFEALRDRYPLNPNVHVFNAEGNCVFITSDAHVVENQRPRAPGRYRSRLEIPGNFLSEGMVSLDVAISTMDPVIVHLWERGLLTCHVVDNGEGGTARGNYAGEFPGAVRPMLPWKTERLDGEEVRLKEQLP